MRSSIQRAGRHRPAICGLAALAAVLSAAAGLYPGEPALAAPPSGLIVVPRPASQPALSYFKLQAQPGSVGRAGVIELRNPTSRRLRVVLSPVDGETLGTLGSGYAPPGSRAHRSALWLQLQRRAVALSPGASTAVPVSATVPALAKPGDYLSGVSIEALDQRSRAVKRRGVSIASISRYAIGVEVSIPGPRHPLIQFTGARIQRQPAGLTFLLLARNPGNVVLQGVHGYVRITRAGKAVVSQPIGSGTFVTQTNIAYPVNAFREAPAEGTRYRITAWMRYQGGIARLDTGVTFGHRQAVIQRQYAHGPSAPSGGTAWWKIAGVAAAILYGLFTTILLLRRRRREPRETVQP
ncbi:MAG: hypothetical protein QOI89_1673 [Solirubrobacteraceae bacterium]|jgi:hypothetical protein|nr:hypothetical protein [Solirubrobacteraceae bacterium]